MIYAASCCSCCTCAEMPRFEEQAMHSSVLVRRLACMSLNLMSLRFLLLVSCNRDDSMSPRGSPVANGRRGSSSHRPEVEQQPQQQQQQLQQHRKQQQQQQQQRKLKLAIAAEDEYHNNSNSSRPVQGLTTPRQQQQQLTECRSPLTARSARAPGGDDCVSVAAHALSLLEGASATEAMLLAAQVSASVYL
jgi:hypothetical protein